LFVFALAGNEEVLVNPLIKCGILTLEAMFVVGSIGSAVVLIWVGFEDFRTMFKPGEEEE
jgi:hypothetical protein